MCYLHIIKQLLYYSWAKLICHVFDLYVQMTARLISAINCKEVLLFASVLDALKTEGDVAYCDTLLHNLVNDIAAHIDSIMSANNLVYIIDMFFMVSPRGEGKVEIWDTIWSHPLITYR